jgi:arylsulfatase A-like enzyme
MLWDADIYIGALMNLLKTKGMYDNALVVYTSDNGGKGDGLNFPLRGEKHTNWDGGMRTAGV